MTGAGVILRGQVRAKVLRAESAEVLEYKLNAALATLAGFPVRILFSATAEDLTVILLIGEALVDARQDVGASSR